MMNKWSVLSLVVCAAMVSSLAGFGCKKAEQKAEAPKAVGQAQTQTQPQAPSQAPMVEGFKVKNGTLQKGGIGFIFSSEKNKAAVASRQLDTPYKNIMKVKGQMKSAMPSGIRNGFIAFAGDSAEKNRQGAKAGILIGAKKYIIDGPLVDKVQRPQEFDQGKVFDFDLTVNLKEKNVTFTVDGQTVTTKMTKAPLSITRIGFVIFRTKTEFSDLQISGN